VSRGAAIACALIAAALFGASAPLLKPIASEVSPLVLAGLLYLGAGASAALLGLGSRARLKREDARWLVGVIVAGGVIGPLLLLIGLKRTSASVSSLLLNLETVFTALLAVAFGERLGARALGAMGLLVAGAALLTFERGGDTRSFLGPLALVGACAAWGLDNNLTQRLSARDPLVVVRYKGLCAGAASLAAGLALGAPLPPWRTVGIAVAIGALAYGLSLALFVRALRELGAARTGMLFATAPFAGALLAIALLHDPPTRALGAAAALMAVGVAVLVTEKRS
jgi:drug/metabolite transporter (DMT)-like permease